MLNFASHAEERQSTKWKIKVYQRTLRMRTCHGSISIFSFASFGKPLVGKSISQILVDKLVLFVRQVIWVVIPPSAKLYFVCI